MKEIKRCQWVGENPLMQKYHDLEWGKPLHDDRKLFEFFVLDAFQAGLSWSTVINKRKNFEKAFHNFDAKKIAKYSQKDVKRLLSDAGIIRNRLKIEATIINAQKFLEIKNEFGSFDKFIWKFSNGKPIQNNFKKLSQLPSKTKLSDEMSEELKEKGFRFVGSTICYAFMQASGMVNDHSIECFRHKQVQKLK
ncbi:MAG: DNA-3-methyladenine glycosylase I [archaeon]|nr:DNA-3-methyladenine glycosylase I [archaeon]